MEPSKTSEPNMAAYGPCDICNAPRAIRETTTNEGILVELLCPTCERVARMVSADSRWFPVPRVVATRYKAKLLRDQAVAEGCTVLDFSATELITGGAADELVCNGEWTATTGENKDVRETIERALVRRGRYPG